MQDKTHIAVPIHNNQISTVPHMGAVQRISNILESKKNLMMHGHVSEWALIGTMPAAMCHRPLEDAAAAAAAEVDAVMATGDSFRFPSDSLIQFSCACAGSAAVRSTRLNIWQTPI